LFCLFFWKRNQWMFPGLISTSVMKVST